MRLPAASAAAFILTMAVLATAQVDPPPDPCTITDTCLEEEHNPDPPPDPPSPWEQFFFWLAISLGAAGATFLIGLLKPLRQHILDRLDNRRNKDR